MMHKIVTLYDKSSIKISPHVVHVENGPQINAPCNNMHTSPSNNNKITII